MIERSEIKRILVATDLDECSESVLEHAKTIARRVQAEIMLLHAVPIYASVEPIPLSAVVMDGAASGQESAAYSALERYRDVHLAEFPNTAPILEAGDPATAILAICRSRDAES